MEWGSSLLPMETWVPPGSAEALRSMIGKLPGWMEAASAAGSLAADEGEGQARGQRKGGPDLARQVTQLPLRRWPI